MQDLIQRLKANYPLLSLITPEEGRAELILARVAIETRRHLYRWSITQGLAKFASDGGWAPVPGISSGDPSLAATALSGGPEDARIVDDKSIVVFLDFSPYLQAPVVVRQFRDAIPQAKDRMITGIFLSPALNLPVDLRREVADVELPFPTHEELSGLVAATCDANKAMTGLERPEGAGLTRLVESARGLTLAEAENALAFSLVSTKQLDAAVVSAEKARAIRGSGALEILKPPPGGLDAVGGLGAVKDWVRTRGRAFSPEAKAYGLPNPKGALLTGIPGTGKSLVAKAAAAALGLPLVRLDVGVLFGSLVGESEANVRAALKMLDAVAPCVCMIDELEKAFAGTGAGQSHDGGTSSRVLGHFLTWTQEHESPVFMIATANNVQALPAEILRRGRWDVMIFADLPTLEEKADILRIHLAARKRDPSKFDVAALSEVARGFTGAELEQAVIDALFDAFADGVEIQTAHIEAAIAKTVPLSQTMAEQVKDLREWSKTRCVPASGVREQTAGKSTPKTGRRVA